MVKFTSKFVSKIACLQHEPRYALLSSKNEKKGFRPSFFGLQWQGISFKKDKNNGLILSDKYIPMELIEILFCYLDHKSLQICQLVCRKWKNLIREYIYSKKVEIISGQSLHYLGSLKIPWEQYYKIYKKNPFEQNLMMNQKEAQLLRIMDYSSNNNSGPYDRKARKCVINLFKEGLPTFFMDYFQPTIEVQQSYKFR
ncbi:uncharacterized protein LOC123269036 isoform X2 [Cotesia glomerata]|nr:uncharacterized protein LOC123269036 isoform X2 [Cotesia glomerata]